MPRWSGFAVKQGWFVYGQESGEVDKKEWLRNNPDFIEWNQDWFEKECKQAFIGENAGGSRQDPPVILFSDREIAEKYARRDWHMASGQGEIIPVLYLELWKDDAWDEDDGEWEFTDELKRDVPDRPGGFACVGRDEVAVFRDSEDGRKAILVFAGEANVDAKNIIWPE